MRNQISQTKLAVSGILILACLLVVSSSGQASATHDAGKVQGRKWWKNGISLAATMFAVVIISYAIIDLGVEHPGFWPALIISGILVMIGFYGVGFNQDNINFWLSTVVGAGLAAVAINSAVVTYAAREL